MIELTTTDRKVIFETFNQNPSGAFVFIKGYEPVGGEGEVADYYIQTGIKYPNVVQASIKKLQEMMRGEHEELTGHILITCNCWKDKQGILHNREAKDRTLVTDTKIYSHSDQVFLDVCKDLLDQLKNPKEKETSFEKEAKGLYSMETKEGVDVLYVRDCLVLRKVIIKFGQQPVKATLPLQALKDYIKRLLPVGNYRMFKLDGRFEKIAINKEEIKP